MKSTFWILNFDAQGPTLTPDVRMAGVFALKTCQRQLYLGAGELTTPPAQAQYLESEAAYHYLLQVVCGLQSQLAGESEILGQFKKAVQDYLATPERHRLLALLLQKTLQDAKKIRHQYLREVGHKTYSAQVRKILMPARPNTVVLLGSGELAEDIIKQLKKKTELVLCARNPERVRSLTEAHNLGSFPWSLRQELWRYPFIVNAIGAQKIFFDGAFFERWLRQEGQHFIDLGHPSCIKTSLSRADGVYRLEDIFKLGALGEQEKEQKLALAQAAVKESAQRRMQWLHNNNLNPISSAPAAVSWREPSLA